MKRHPLDILSLLMGAVFLLVALAYVVGDLMDAIPSALTTMPLMLAGLGIAGLVGAFAAMQRAGERATETAAVTTAQNDWSGPSHPGTGGPASDIVEAAALPTAMEQPTTPASQDTVVFPAEGSADRDA